MMIQMSSIWCALTVVVIVHATVNAVSGHDYATFKIASPRSVQPVNINLHPVDDNRSTGHFVIVPSVQGLQQEVDKKRHGQYTFQDSDGDSSHFFSNHINVESSEADHEAAPCKTRSRPPKEALCAMSTEFMERIVTVGQNILTLLESVSTPRQHERVNGPCVSLAYLLQRENSSLPNIQTLSNVILQRSTPTRASVDEILPADVGSSPLPQEATEATTEIPTENPTSQKPYRASITINDKGEIVSTKIEYDSEGEESKEVSNDGRTVSPQILSMLLGLEEGSMKENKVEDISARVESESRETRLPEISVAARAAPSGGRKNRLHSKRRMRADRFKRISSPV